MQPVKWGVLSTAKIGTVKVIPAMQRADLCDGVAIASRDKATAEAAQSLWECDQLPAYCWSCNVWWAWDGP